MGRTALEVADIFRAHGPAWPQAQRAHLSFGQLKVMSAIEGVPQRGTGRALRSLRAGRDCL